MQQRQADTIRTRFPIPKVGSEPCQQSVTNRTSYEADEEGGHFSRTRKKRHCWIHGTTSQQDRYLYHNALETISSVDRPQLTVLQGTKRGVYVYRTAKLLNEKSSQDDSY